jgi:hypothetical protein
MLSNFINKTEWLATISTELAEIISLVSQLENDLKKIGICEIVHVKSDAYVRHIKTGTLVGKLNVIEGTFGFLPSRKIGESETAIYFRLVGLSGDGGKMSDFRLQLNAEVNHTMKKHKVDCVDIFPIKDMC